MTDRAEQLATAAAAPDVASLGAAIAPQVGGEPAARPKLRIFVSSPTDVGPERRRVALIIEHLAKDYGRFFEVEFILCDTEPMRASGHFLDHLTPPAEKDIVVVIVWSRLGSPLPQETAVPENKSDTGQ